MKKYISSFLIPSYLLQILSCATISIDRGEENTISGPVTFMLNDGQIITADSENCIFVKNHQLVVWGIGNYRDKETKRLTTFKGQIFGETIDSLKKITIHSQENLICWVKDSTRVAFEPGNYEIFSLNPDSSYWLIKNYSRTWQLNVDNIKDVQVSQISTAGWIIIGAVITAGLVGLILIGSELKGCKGGTGSSGCQLPKTAYYK